MPVIPVNSRALSIKLNQNRYPKVNNETSGKPSPISHPIKEPYPTKKFPHCFSSYKNNVKTINKNNEQHTVK